MKSGRYILYAVAVMGLAGCTPRNLYVAHDTVLGVNASVNQARQKGQLVIGYDRDFATIIPTTVKIPGTENETDAMSLVNCTDLEIDGIFLNKYVDVIATGDAAVDLIKSGNLDASQARCEIEKEPAKKGGAT